MSRKISSNPTIHISGDTLALDPAIRKQINAEAEKLQQRYPTTPVTLRIGISEEFDRMNGHRVRCELAADLPGRRQLMVREAKKEAFAAITSVFAVARKQIRRISSRCRQPGMTTSGGMRVAGT